MENPFDKVDTQLTSIKNKLEELEEAILTISKPRDQAISFIDIDQLAELLKPWYTKGSIYHLISDNNFPKYKIGKKLFFKEAEVSAWIHRHKI